MKRTVLFTCLLLALSTVAFASPAPSEIELASMRNEIFGPAPTDAASQAPRASCTVSNDCDAQPTISCTSSVGNCHSGSNWVECDGNRTYCAAPPATCTISTSCPSGGGVSCTGTASYGCYKMTNCWVECSTGLFRCPNTNCPI